MPRDISSSSSGEDEADSPAAEPAVREKATGFQCPADFVSFCHKPCSSTLTHSLKKSNNDLWLIKAPANFNPESFSGVKLSLSGLQTLKVPSAAGGSSSSTSGGQQVYSVLASSHGASDLRLLTADRKSSNGVFGPSFSGLLNVCETYGDPSANQSPQVIPAAPAPSIPPGLKQRFLPFGSKTPTLTCVAENEVDGTLVVKRFVEEVDREEEEDERRKNKKKKKEKRIKTEQVEEQEMVRVKQEPVQEIHEEVEEDVTEERRRKKKKKRDREREEVEDGLEPSVSLEEEITVKSEPVDTLHDDAAAVEGSGRKKKKKKKSKTDDE